MNEPQIRILSEKKLIGKRIRTTPAENRTQELWRSFMPRLKEIQNKSSADLFSIQVYDASLDFKNFNPNTPFEKWAAAEVENFNTVPDEMESFVLTGGKYAVFLYKGDPRAFANTFQYIFGTWLPNSGYMLDKRPHFELMGEKYKNDSPDSEEEIWVPVKRA